MNTVIINHVALADLPTAWRARLSNDAPPLVTIRIEEEPQTFNNVSGGRHSLVSWFDEPGLSDDFERHQAMPQTRGEF